MKGLAKRAMNASLESALGVTGGQESAKGPYTLTLTGIKYLLLI